MKWIKRFFDDIRTENLRDEIFIKEIEYELECLDRISKSDNGSNFNAGMKYAYNNTLKLFKKYHRL